LAAGAVALFFVACLVVSAQEPPKKDGPGGKGDPKGGQKGEGKGRPGGPGGPGGGFGGPRPKPGTILPGPMQESLKLTADQKKQIDELQKVVDEKLAKILTEEQKKQLKEMAERPIGGFGRPGGPGGPGGGFPPKKDQ
jgi:Spy/CpxP family protein refolding chaperone